uniref:arylamine N-acetyltransferase n=1 Tax=Ciona savignyi TaxID=51511 RepID=H2ZLG9_CIOSA
MNVKDYLARIKYYGSLEPTLRNLRLITLAHRISIPYTNLQVHGGDRLVLDLNHHYDTIVTKQGAGLCYDINGLFAYLLQQLGYKVKCIESAFFDGPTKEFTLQRLHLTVTVDFGNLGRYIVDPAWSLVGPLKMERMVPYNDGNTVYRLRQVPGKGNDWYYLERHRKSILDKNGCVLKQGPTSIGKYWNGWCDDECAKEESSHWKFEQRICDEVEYQLEDFRDMIDHIYSPDCAMSYTAMLLKVNMDSHVMLMGDTAVKKIAMGPLTEKIMDEKKI